MSSIGIIYWQILGFVLSIIVINPPFFCYNHCHKYLGLFSQSLTEHLPFVWPLLLWNLHFLTSFFYIFHPIFAFVLNSILYLCIVSSYINKHVYYLLFSLYFHSLFPFFYLCQSNLFWTYIVSCWIKYEHFFFSDSCLVNTDSSNFSWILVLIF